MEKPTANNAAQSAAEKDKVHDNIKNNFNNDERSLLIEGLNAKEASAKRSLNATRNPDLAKCYTTQIKQISELVRKLDPRFD